MANFNGLILTQAGADLQDKIAVSGASLQFTRAAIGDGLWPAGLDPTTLTALVSEKKSLAIQGLADEGTGQHKISVLVDNTNLTVGFMTREIGVFATDPELGEILYQVTSADSPDYLPPDGGATHIEMALDLLVVTSSAASVTAIINSSLVYASKNDLENAQRFSRLSALTGGGDGALDAIPWGDVSDKQIASVAVSGNLRTYYFDKSSEAPEDGESVIMPDDAGAKPGRWIRAGLALNQYRLTTVNGCLALEEV